jgi:hypothetical protein
MFEICRLNVFLVHEDEAKVQDQAVVAAQRSLDLSVTRCKRGVTRNLEGSRRKGDTGFPVPSWGVPSSKFTEKGYAR